jgi:hypothetical protein
VRTRIPAAKKPMRRRACFASMLDEKGINLPALLIEGSDSEGF